MERGLYAIVILLLASPVVLLSAAWDRVLSRRFPVDRRDRVLLTAITLSYLLMLSGLAFQEVLGSDYSLRRFVTLYANLILMAVIAGWATLRKGSLGGLMSLLSMLMVLVWLYATIVSSLV